jgi:predicted short-subunit dehydrogenase-like oxidoreductase (DUF2520 family)
MAASQKTLNIIGAGKVGRVFGRLFARHGVFLVQDILTRSMPSASAAADFIGVGRAVASLADLHAADVYMLAVGDDQIAACCAALAATGLLRPGDIVFHCSGALSSHDLQAAANCGATRASMHPVRSFADPEQVAATFANTYCSLEGDPCAVALLTGALAAIGAQSVAIDAAAKTLYHAASVFASNYLTTLIDTALRAYVAAGIPEQEARLLAQPLVAGTLDNIFRLGPAAALTGPIARGDWATVAKQQTAVDAWDSAAGDLYRELVHATKGLTQRKAGTTG